MKRNSLRKYFTLILLFFTVAIGFSSWIIVGEKNVNVGKAPSNRAVAYIEYDSFSNNDYTASGSYSSDYTSIEGALKKAESGDTVHVILNTSDPAVIRYDCEIKSGVLLNISYEDKYVQEENDNGIVEATLRYIDADDEDDGDDNTNPKYNNITERNLTNTIKIDDNVNVINNGMIIISGELSGSQGGGVYVGHTCRNYAKLIMGNNSKIDNYGKIQCCGFIEESSLDNGSIIINYSGASLRMPFVLRDFRGGTTSYGIYKVIDDMKVSPFNQFEVENIHCKIRVNYGSDLSCYANIYAASSMNKTLIGMIGADDSYFISLYNSDKTDYENYYAYIKYDKSSSVCSYDLYGGGIINKLVININVSIVGEISISTENVFFPLSWRMSLSMNKYDDQEDTAIFKAENQRIKLMTGSSLIVNEGCEFISNDMIVYSFFRGRKNVLNSSNVGGTSYETKDSAIFKVYGKYTCNGSFGGLIIKGVNAEITSTASSVTSYEALYQNDPLLPINIEIQQWTVVSEVKTEIYESEYNSKKRVTVGVIKVDTWGTPTYRINSILTSDASYNYNFFLSSGSSFTPKLLTNILSATYNGNYYVKGNSLSVSVNSTFIIKATSSTVGSVDTSSVTITASTDEVAVGSTLQLNAKAYNSSGNESYTTKFNWSSSDTSKATVNSNGVVTGVAMADSIVITATSKDDNSISGTYTINVTDPTVLLGVIVSASKESGGANTAYDTTISVTLNPSTAEVNSVTWSLSDNDNILTLKTDTSDYSKTYTVAANSSTWSNKTATITVTVVDIHGNSKSDNVTLTATKKDSSCIAAGTLITMADGTEKAIENIEPGEMIMSLNHETGQYETNKVFIKVNHGYSLYNVMKLKFSDNSELKLIGNHGLFDVTLNKYIPITEDNLYKCVGHEFLKYNDYHINDSVKLISAEIIEEYTESYTIASEQNMNHIINGLVGNITTVDGIYNFFEFDSNLKYDEIKMKKDINKYGLYTYEEFSSYTTEYVFNAINMRYYKISVGKGIMTYEDVLGVLEIYNTLLENGELEEG